MKRAPLGTALALAASIGGQTLAMAAENPACTTYRQDVGNLANNFYGAIHESGVDQSKKDYWQDILRRGCTAMEDNDHAGHCFNAIQRVEGYINIEAFHGGSDLPKTDKTEYARLNQLTCAAK